MIVYPNYNRLIHDENSVSDFYKKQYRYPNVYREGLKMKLHS